MKISEEAIWEVKSSVVFTILIILVFSMIKKKSVLKSVANMRIYFSYSKIYTVIGVNNQRKLGDSTLLIYFAAQEI